MLVFGYGSLINSSSLWSTVPNAFDLKPAFIKGYMRDFSVHASLGFTDTNLDMPVIPFCALGIKKAAKNKDIVNGIVFDLNKNDLEKLKHREIDYSLEITTAYDFFNPWKSIGKVYVFISNNNSGIFDINSKVQKRYLDICLSGAKEYGENFYDTFINTTYLNNQKLSDFIKITKYS